MSSASSNQSFVRDEAGYEELYPSGYKDPDELSERSPSATSPSSKMRIWSWPNQSKVRCIDILTYLFKSIFTILLMIVV